MIITNRGANMCKHKAAKRAAKRAATRRQQGGNKAATGCVTGCNKGLQQRAATKGCHKGCNRAATGLQQGCNRGATNPTSPCQHFLNTFFEALSTSSAQKTWQKSTSKIDQIRRRQTSILDMLLTTSRSTYASKQCPNRDKWSIRVSCFSRHLGRQRIPNTTSKSRNRDKSSIIVSFFHDVSVDRGFLT